MGRPAFPIHSVIQITEQKMKENRNTTTIKLSTTLKIRNFFLTGEENKTSTCYVWFVTVCTWNVSLVMHKTVHSQNITKT